ncbi:sigma 54-interacting transcriptional regulator [Polyangium jinanense]|uniref:Sigma 54-interacting transcriptional regulator n=1 Tax=Polyangium jinanense TaxID=2829994 RepID=A0A9X4AV62_9BACT|nr:sigma 54-interacting transcriptional regulator [Polyangium jinanense]MDC3958870.1 sigma 54-interacting transcriptional regulator [Polyangium jinanense]MDC3985984.1 sigma 54-interacting transcriptional regulator [Polyangium jinanense]
MNLDEWVAGSTRELADLAQLADGTPAALDELLHRGLEWLGRIAPYDLAVIFELEGALLRARAGRGSLFRPEVREYRIHLDHFPSIRLAIEERRSRVFTEDDHAHGDGDLFDGLMDFPHGHACMVVPLVTGSEVFGVMSIDRARCGPYPRAVVDLVEVFGRLLALSIHCIRQNQRLARAGLESEERAAALERRIGEITEDASVLGDSDSSQVRELARQAALVAGTSSTVLLIGETGTGKERLARFIHEKSPRGKRPFIPVNCAALPSGTLESELFGHERGAFSGALRARPGLFRAADGGTLFLDEIGELPLDLQGKLLRALQEGEVLPVGAEQAIKVSVRVIAATHVDLEQAVAAGRFRGDLYYRLSVYPLRLVPLRERMEDLPAICRVLLQELSARVGKASLRLSAGAQDALRHHDYPGNIRELSNILERGAIRAASGTIERADLALFVSLARKRPAAGEGGSTEALVTLAENERRHIQRVLRATGGRIYGEGGAAAILGLPPTTLQSRMKRLGLRRETNA